MAVVISSVRQNSPAHIHSIKAGETLCSINGNVITDVLDYRFYQLERNLSLDIVSENGEHRTVLLKKAEYEEIGLEFSTYLMDEQRSCRNKCIFCFIDQLPRGLRKSLYFKDDDSRLSFLFGNYITLTNLTEHEIERIIKMHISPVNVSVHTTNPELRVKMMNNRFAGESLKTLRRFTDAGIAINCQIVCCPGINDGEELVCTLSDLDDMNVAMTAVVPVGLTGFREGLYPLTAYTKETAIQTLEIVERFGKESLEKTGARRFFAADELYIKAGREIPDADFYEDFPALENGVGLIALLRDEVDFELEQIEVNKDIHRTVSLACGTSAAPYLREITLKITEKFPNVTVNVYPIQNNFFGGQINVSGLVVGSDLISQLKNKQLGERLLIPSVMLDFDNALFLDDTTPKDVEQALNISVIPVNNNGEQLINAIVN